jgi:hypothetical protein
MTWLQTTAPSNIWTSVASSADGTKLVAVGEGAYDYDTGAYIGSPIYTSPDSGATWTQASAPRNFWSSVASSADGTKLVAVGRGTFDINTGYTGSIYTSRDSGATWRQTSAPRNSWTSVASSADGTKLVAVVGRTALPGLDTGKVGPIYTSPDFGGTWTQASAPSNSWSSVASSADGTRLVAVGRGPFDPNSGYIGSPIYTSRDSGATWTQTSAPTTNWTSVASSADGTKLVAVYNNGIYSSTDSGATWKTTSPLEFTWDWTSVASSADGSKLVAARRGGIYVSPYLGPWRLTSAPTTNWTSVASSANGTKVVAVASFGPIYNSTDSGASWTATSAPSTNYWHAVASSTDGTKVVAVERNYNINNQSIGGQIYTSPDSGATWTQTTAPTRDWLSVAASADGTKLLGASWNEIYTSADSGATWITRPTAPRDFWSSVASSADGTKVVAVSNSGPIYTSTDSGASWTVTSAPTTNWTSVASSADGTKLVAVVGGSYDNTGKYIGGPIYTSLDSGATWTQTSAPSNFWSSVASSADGSKLVAVVNQSPYLIYVSTNSGATWTQAGAPGESWAAVASSADGSNLVAVASYSYFGSGIYTLQFPTPPPPSPPSPRLAISASGLSLGISWLVPSTSFVLQQNSDLSSTNWTDTPTAPTLNFTDLHYQVTVSSSLGSRFYRLKQQ